MPTGDRTVCLLLGLLAVLGVALAFAQVALARRRLELVRAAIEAGQPEVATALLSARWSALGVRALVLATLGLGALIAGAAGPDEFAGLLVIGFMLLIAAAPLLVYAHVRQGTAGTRRDAVVAAVCVLVFMVVVMPLVSWLALAVLPGPAGRRAGELRGNLQRLAQEQDFAARVRRLAGSPPGTAHPTIRGQRAEGCLWGTPYALQSCGSHYHPQLRFSTLKPDYLNVYYLPQTEEYLVIGTALVQPCGRTVTDGFISAREALARPGPAQ